METVHVDPAAGEDSTADFAVTNPEAATMMAAMEVAKVLASKGYRVTVRPPALMFYPGDTLPVPACDIIFMNEATKEAKASVLTLRDYPSMLAASKGLPKAGNAKLHIPMGPIGGIRA